MNTPVFPRLQSHRGPDLLPLSLDVVLGPYVEYTGSTLEPMEGEVKAGIFSLRLLLGWHFGW